MGGGARSVSPATDAQRLWHAEYIGRSSAPEVGRRTVLSQQKGVKCTFKNTLSSTLWRFIETNGLQLPMVGMISAHPHPSRRPPEFDPLKPCRHCIQSSAFAAQFSRISEQVLFEALTSYCAPRNGGPLGISNVILVDDNGDEHVFSFETFFIRYRPPALGEALSLGVYVEARRSLVAV
jgi:hypothetical protein